MKTQITNPLVSIALATHNGEKFLSKQLESLLNQTYKNIEIIISDDGSKDRTENIIQGYAKTDPRIVFSKNPAPNGYKKNFERVILLCKGDIIFLCDQDDIWYENKIEKHLKAYENENVNWVYNEVRLIDSVEKNLGLMTDLFKDYYDKINILYKTGGRCILGCATSYRASSLKYISPINDLAPGHDSWIQLTIWPKKYSYLNTVLQDYRQHADNAVGVFKNSDSNIEENIKKSILYVKELYKYKAFPIWKRIIFFIFYGGKKIHFYFKINTARDIRFRLYYLTIFRLKTYIRRRIFTFLKFHRPASYPYITGDGFRALAQHIFDENSNINCESVMSGDIVFVRADLLFTYFKEVHPKIKNQYILISHNSDENIDFRFEKFLDEKIIHWFAQNLIIKHPKCTPIPIGLKLRLYDKKNTIINLLEKYKLNTTRFLKIFYAFTEETNRKRAWALEQLRNSNISVGSEKTLEKEEYYRKLSEYYFNASPEGGGIDCHRTWESIYLNTIPIIEKKVMTEYWERIGLPVLLIDSWDSIKTVSEKILIEKYKKIKDKFSSPAMYMDYWIKLIIDKKNGK